MSHVADHVSRTAAGLAILALYIRQRGDTLSRQVGGQKFFARTESSKRSRVAVDGTFLRRLWKLLKIVMPGVLTPEAGFAATVSLMMIARTLCDLWMLKTSTTIEAAIIGRDKAAFGASRVLPPTPWPPPARADLS